MREMSESQREDTERDEIERVREMRESQREERGDRDREFMNEICCMRFGD